MNTIIFFNDIDDMMTIFTFDEQSSFSHHFALDRHSIISVVFFTNLLNRQFVHGTDRCHVEPGRSGQWFSILQPLDDEAGLAELANEFGAGRKLLDVDVFQGFDGFNGLLCRMKNERKRKMNISNIREMGREKNMYVQLTPHFIISLQ